MRVLMVNGSPRKEGITKRALKEVAAPLEATGIEVAWFELGNKPVRGCIGCEGCARNGGRCVFKDDAANELVEAILAADGVVVGTPTYFAGANGALLALLDRAFYAASAHGHQYAGKFAASVATDWRAGAVSACDDINRYFLYSGMHVVASDYWPVRFSTKADAWGDNILRVLGERMAGLLKEVELR